MIFSAVVTMTKELRSFLWMSKCPMMASIRYSGMLIMKKQSRNKMTRIVRIMRGPPYVHGHGRKLR